MSASKLPECSFEEQAYEFLEMINKNSIAKYEIHKVKDCYTLVNQQKVVLIMEVKDWIFASQLATLVAYIRSEKGGKIDE